MQAPSFNKPVTATAFGLLTNESILKFVPFNPNDEGECENECVVAIGLTSAQGKSLLLVPRQMSERIPCLQCSRLELAQTSTFTSISGPKATSVLLLTDQHAGNSTMPGRRPTQATICEQTSLTIVKVSILNLRL